MKPNSNLQNSFAKMFEMLELRRHIEMDGICFVFVCLSSFV